MSLGADLHIEVCHCHQCQSSNSPVGRIVDTIGNVLKIFVDKQDAWRALAELQGIRRIDTEDWKSLWEEIIRNQTLPPTKGWEERRRDHQHLHERCYNVPPPETRGG